MLNKSTQALLCGLAISGFAATAAHAATSEWTGDGADSSWATDANWDTPPVFDGTDDIKFFNGIPSSGETLTMGGDRTVNSVYFDAGYGRSMTLGQPDTTDTLTLVGDATLRMKYLEKAVVNVDVLLGADGTFKIQKYKPFVINGDVSETGGSRGLHTFTERNNRIIILNGNNSYTGGTTVTGVKSDVDGNNELEGGLMVTSENGLGTGDVTMNHGSLSLQVLNAIDPSAALTLGDDQDEDWILDLGFTGTQSVAGLTIDGNAIAPGTTYSASDYTGSAGAIIGDGQLLVTVPEPASLALLGLGGLALLGQRRRRDVEA